MTEFTSIFGTVEQSLGDPLGLFGAEPLGSLIPDLSNGTGTSGAALSGNHGGLVTGEDNDAFAQWLREQTAAQERSLSRISTSDPVTGIQPTVAVEQDPSSVQPLSQFAQASENTITPFSATSLPITSAPVTSAQTTPVRIEAESFEFENYRIKRGDFASGDRYLQVSAWPGRPTTASFTVDQPAGRYDIVVGYYDEADGNATYSLTLNNNEYQWIADADTGTPRPDADSFIQRTVVSGAELTPGQTIELTATRIGRDVPSFDFVELIPSTETITTPGEGIVPIVGQSVALAGEYWTGYQSLTDQVAQKGDLTNLIVGDFNGDGADDFIRQEKGSWDNDDYRTAEIFLALGDGTFSQQLMTDFTRMKGDETRFVVGDFNGDGADDFILQQYANFEGDDGQFPAQLYFSNRDGTFDAVEPPATWWIMQGHLATLEVGDFNGDGRDDLMRREQGRWADIESIMATTYLSNGDGSFREVGLPEDWGLRSDFTKLHIGDFNGDGVDDFIGQSFGGEVDDAKVYLGRGDGSFERIARDPDWWVMDGDLTNLMVGDFNGDGWDDFIRQEKGYWDTDEINRANVYLSQGDGTFRWQFLTDMLDMKGDLTTLIVGDYNGDGADDFIRQEKGVWDDDRIRTAEIYFSNRNGTFTREEMARSFSLKGDFTNLIVGDYDGDGRTDYIRQEKGEWDDNDRTTAEVFLSHVLDGNQFRVEYFNNKELSGRPVRTAVTEGINFAYNWGDGSPGVEVRSDQFSARFTGNLDFEGGFYNFATLADDGLRVYIDGILVNDKWVAANPWERHDAFILIPEGTHEVKIEYFEEGGIAGINFDSFKTALADGYGGELRPVGFDGAGVHGTYVYTYMRSGGIEELGYPLNNVHPWENGYTQDFEGGADGRGAIMKSNANDNSYWVGGQIWQRFLDLGSANYLGYPTTDYLEINGGLDNVTNGGGIVQHFSGNVGIPTKIWLSEQGAHPTWGAIGSRYDELGGATSFLGFPTTGEVGIGDGWIRQDFENGYILWHPNYGAVPYDNTALDGLAPDSGNGSENSWIVDYWPNRELAGTSVWTEVLPEGELRFGAGQGAPLGTRGVPEDDFSARWVTTDYFEGGLYNFINQADDGVRVYLNDELIIDKWRDSPFETEESFTYVPHGYHEVKVEYFERGGIAANTLKWEKLESSEEWIGEFYNGINLDGSAAQPYADYYGGMTGGDGFLDEHWGETRPTQIQVPFDQFSDRWTKLEYFEAGAYQFNTQADDGIRLWVDGELVIDKWQDQPFVTNSAVVSLDEGYHELKLEHFENYGAAALTMDWQQVSDDPVWVAEYFDNTDLQGAPVLNRVEGTGLAGFNRNWGVFSPIEARDNFSARWTTQTDFAEGQYRFYVGSDDGVRLYINGELMLDQWVPRAYTTDTVDITLAEGTHEIVMEYYELTGDAQAGIHWDRFSPQILHTTGEWSDSIRGSQPATIQADFNAVYQEVATTIGEEQIGVPTTAVYGFESPNIPAGDDGFFLPVVHYYGEIQEFRGELGEGAILRDPLDADGIAANTYYLHGPIWESFQKMGGIERLGFPVADQETLDAGGMRLELENGVIFYAPGMDNATYYQYSGGDLTLPADAWRGEYFDNENWEGTPWFVREDSGSGGVLYEDWRDRAPRYGFSTDNFSVRWTTDRAFDRGTHALTTTHDDGLIVTVDGQGVVNRPDSLAFDARDYVGLANSGQYEIEARYREFGGLAYVSLGNPEKVSDYVVGLYEDNQVDQSIIDAFWARGGYHTVGIPINDMHRWGPGSVQDFRQGSDGETILINPDYTDETFYISGAIWGFYRNSGNIELYGYPTSQAFDDGHGNSAQNFGHQRITHQPNGETFRGGYVNGVLLDGDWYRVWSEYALGVPEGSDGYFYQDYVYRYFQHPDLGRVSAVQSSHGTFPLWGGIRSYYVSVGGLGSVLGAPTSGEHGWNGYTRQNFEGGYILWNGSAIAYNFDGSLMFPPSNGAGGAINGSDGISYGEYIQLLYGDSNGVITQTYENHGGSGRAIDSADTAGPYNVYSLVGGTVQYVGPDQYGGNYVSVWNAELQRNFIYLHFDSFGSDLYVGKQISQGHYLGQEGATGLATGRHTHVHVTDAAGNRENPLNVLGRFYGSNPISIPDNDSSESGSDSPIIGVLPRTGGGTPDFPPIEYDFLLTSVDRPFSTTWNLGVTYLVEGTHQIDGLATLNHLDSSPIDLRQDDVIAVEQDLNGLIGLEIEFPFNGNPQEISVSFADDLLTVNTSSLSIFGTPFTGIFKGEFGQNITTIPLSNNDQLVMEINIDHSLDGRYHRQLSGNAPAKVLEFAKVVLWSGEDLREATDVLLEEYPEVKVWVRGLGITAGVAAVALAAILVVATITGPSGEEIPLASLTAWVTKFANILTRAAFA